jgi:vancomycin resistance protein YoaR
MTTEQAQEAIENFIAELGKAEITLLAEENQKVVVTANDMGLAWTNTEILDEALGLCTEGNVIARYKAIKDLERGHKVYPIEFAFSAEAIEKILLEKCTVFDRAMKEFKLKKVGETFRITEGYDGYALNVAESLQAITAVMNENWNREGVQIALVKDVTKTKGSTESLSQVKDILGTNTSSYVTSADGRSANVERGAYLMNGVLLYPGEEFSALKLATPFSIANGYHLAGSYLNGKVVDSLGGGICQVTTCLYNAVLQAELEVVERYNHSMTVPYAEPAADAAITQSGGKDFRFVNNNRIVQVFN